MRWAGEKLICEPCTSLARTVARASTAVQADLAVAAVCLPLFLTPRPPFPQMMQCARLLAATPPPTGRRSRDYTDGLRRYESQRHTLKGFLAWLRKSVGAAALVHGLACWGCCAGGAAASVHGWLEQFSAAESRTQHQGSCCVMRRKFRVCTYSNVPSASH